MAEPKVESEFIDLSDTFREDEEEHPLRLGTYDIVRQEVIVLEDKIVFRHYISLKYGPPPKKIQLGPAGETSHGGG
jgi:hypothetical protein